MWDSLLKSSIELKRTFVTSGMALNVIEWSSAAAWIELAPLVTDVWPPPGDLHGGLTTFLDKGLFFFWVKFGNDYYLSKL